MIPEIFTIHNNNIFQMPIPEYIPTIIRISKKNAINV